MIPKRKPIPANRHTRRAEGIKLIKVKRGGGSSGPSLVDLLKQAIIENDTSVAMSAGLLSGEKGWLFHRAGAFTYAVTVGKHVTLHAVNLHGDIHATYKKLIPMGEFGKGCIQFKSDAKVDMDMIAQLIQACVEGSE